MSKTLAIIFAGGSGVRMGAGKPKQFLEVDGKPIIIHTLDIFENHPAVDEIYIACKEDYISRLEKMIGRYDITKVRAVVPGGTTGMGSIYNALKAAFEQGDPSGELAQKACELHKKWLCLHWDEYSKEAHIGLTMMYVADPRFTAYYDKIAVGCAAFLHDAVSIYCK